MMYTLTSTEVETFEQLQAAVSASHGAFSGSVDYTQEDRNIISNSQETLIAFGGSQEASKAAILDLEKFFVPVEATQAVPISYEIRDIKGNVARVGDITEYKVQSCTARDKDRKQRVTVTYDTIKSLENCDFAVAGTTVNELRGNLNAFGRKIGSVNTDLETGKSSNLSASSSQTFTNPTSSTSFTVSGNLYESDSPSANDIIGSYSFKHTYPWSDDVGPHKKTLSGDGCSVELSYRISLVDID